MGKVKAIIKMLWVFCIVAGITMIIPTDAKAEDIHYLTPYQTSGMNNIYNGDATRSFTMMGTTYRYGVTPDNYTAEKQILYNLDGQFSSVSMQIGCIDNRKNENAKMYVYFDEKLMEEKILTKEMMTTLVQFDTTGVKQLRIDMISEKGYNNIWYGLGNVIGVGGHLYQTEMTKKPSLDKTGIYTHICSVCGYSYTESIPEQKSCVPYLVPYDAPGQTVYSKTEDAEDYFLVMGKRYYQGVFASNWSSEKIQLYNLNQQYTSVTFKVGHMDGKEMTDATLYVYVDGSTSPMKTVSLTSDMLSKEVTLPTTGVIQLKLLIKAKEGYQNAFYAIYDMNYITRSSKSHSFLSEETLSPNYGQSGIRTYTCNDCGLTYTEMIPALKENLGQVKVLKSNYTYTGNKIKPVIIVKDKKGRVVAPSNYTVKYSSNVNVGRASITVVGKAAYEGTIKATFDIIPEGTKIDKLKAVSKGFRIDWRKQTKQTTGYVISYSTDKQFKKSTTKMMTVEKAMIVSKQLSKLKANQKYYVRIRTFKTVEGKKYYSDWSKVKTVKTRKG